VSSHQPNTCRGTQQNPAQPANDAKVLVFRRRYALSDAVHWLVRTCMHAGQCACSERAKRRGTDAWLGRDRSWADARDGLVSNRKPSARAPHHRRQSPASGSATLPYFCVSLFAFSPNLLSCAVPARASSRIVSSPQCDEGLPFGELASKRMEIGSDGATAGGSA
jgi:hypothetical protein